jgi:hypothetical protein
VTPRKKATIPAEGRRGRAGLRGVFSMRTTPPNEARPSRRDATVALVIFAVAAFVAMLTYTSAALTKEDKSTPLDGDTYETPDVHSCYSNPNLYLKLSPFAVGSRIGGRPANSRGEAGKATSHVRATIRHPPCRPGNHPMRSRQGPGEGRYGAIGQAVASPWGCDRGHRFGARADVAVMPWPTLG